MEIKILKNKIAVAENFATFLKKLIEDNKQLHVALSGGSTPKIIFDHIAENFGHIDWSKVYLYWGDERCVPPTDNESNYKMTFDHLISKINIPKENIFRVLGEDNPVKEAKRYALVLEKNLVKENKVPQFDLVILGMGDDGHTASIFPHEMHLWNANENCVVATHPESGQKRISITGKIINNAKQVGFLVTGGNKAEKVEEIFNNKASIKKYPAALVKPLTGNLLWFLDEDAAQDIYPAIKK